MATYQITLTNGFVHSLQSFGLAVETAFSLRDYVAEITVDGGAVSFDELNRGVGSKIVDCPIYPHGQPMFFDAREDEARD
jgi:hypothetical protein